MDIDVETVIQVVREVCNVAEADLFNVPQGRRQGNPALSAALYIARKTAVKSLNEITEAFSLAHYGSVSGTIGRFAKQIQLNK